MWPGTTPKTTRQGLAYELIWMLHTRVPEIAQWQWHCDYASFRMLCDGDSFMGVEMGGDKMMVLPRLLLSLPILNNITSSFSDFFNPQPQNAEPTDIYGYVGSTYGLNMSPLC